MKESTIKTVIDGVSELIYSTAKALEMEQKHPGMCADTMDDNLKTLKERFYQLSSIRCQLEITCADVILENSTKVFIKIK